MDKNSFLVELSESDKTQFGKIDFNEQSKPQQVFSTIWELESEVNNGGFSQYFFNSSRETAHFVVEALETIQAPLMADICSRAIRTGFPEGLPADSDQIQAVASDFSDETSSALGTLDQEFYEYPNNLTELLFAYVQQHPEEFGNVPEVN